MKKLIAFLMILCMLPGVGALAESDTLVVYFSCTGTTQGVAERLANVTGADLYEIVPAEPYTDEDLNYNDRSTRATWEQDHPDTRAFPTADPTSPGLMWYSCGRSVLSTRRTCCPVLLYMRIIAR